MNVHEPAAAAAAAAAAARSPSPSICGVLVVAGMQTVFVGAQHPGTADFLVQVPATLSATDPRRGAAEELPTEEPQTPWSQGPLVVVVGVYRVLVRCAMIQSDVLAWLRPLPPDGTDHHSAQPRVAIPEKIYNTLQRFIRAKDTL